SSRCPEPSTLATSSHHPTFVRATITRFSNRSFYLVSSPLRTILADFAGFAASLVLAPPPKLG
ncbi:MAG: hypothetical protein AB7J34_26040, partial [Limisphaerales bacterium]